MLLVVAPSSPRVVAPSSPRVVAPSSPRVVLHLCTRPHAPPPIAASLAASASLAAAVPPAAQLAAPCSELRLGPGLGARAGAGPCVSDDDDDDDNDDDDDDDDDDEGGEYPRERPSTPAYDPPYEPGDDEVARIRKRQRPEQRSEPSQAAHMHMRTCTRTCTCTCTCTLAGEPFGCVADLEPEAAAFLGEQRPALGYHHTQRAAVSTPAFLIWDGCDHAHAQAAARQMGWRWRS